MIDVYSWPTPNGQKIHIMLEECGQRLGRDWRAHAVDIGAGEQFAPSFLTISPNHKIPAIVDPDGPDGKPLPLFESGAILVYLASKFGKRLPRTDRQKYEVLQWLMFQMGGVGPMLGQAHHFRGYAPEKIGYAIDRYTNEAKRLYRVMDQRLQASAWLGGRSYSIADIATFPWVNRWERQGIDWADYPHLRAWYERIGARPAVRRGLAVLADRQKPLTTPEARAVLFSGRSPAPR